MSIAILAALAPSSARLVESEVVREVPVDALRRGQLVEVRAGESRLREVSLGDAVHPGTVTLEARLFVHRLAGGFVAIVLALSLPWPTFPRPEARASWK